MPPWFISELAGFLKRGGQPTAKATAVAGERNAGDVTDQVLSLLNPGYGGRASPSKGQVSRHKATTLPLKSDNIVGGHGRVGLLPLIFCALLS